MGPGPVVVQACDGWPLGVRRVRAVGEAHGTVLLLHAMMVDARTFDRPAGRGLQQTLRAAGLDVVVADFRGHGDSGPGASEGGTWSYEDLVLRDLPALVAAARRWGRGRLGVVGHSLGGHVTAAALAAGAVHVDALVCLAANVWLAASEPSLRVRAAKAVGLAGLQGAALLAGRVPARRLGLGSTDEAGPYADDLGRPFWQQRWGTRDARQDWLAGLGRVGVPTLAVVARGDRLLARPAGALGWAAHLPAVQTRVVGDPDAGVLDHMGVLTNAEARGIHTELAAWLVGVLALDGGSGSGT
ncbi:MAG: alpha/beta fold hydrolase [Alphaproteobacteria bacterium]|nr:alpha/beta fold hydrolase [Alphaproteobacteria bacterium]